MCKLEKYLNVYVYCCNLYRLIYIIFSHSQLLHLPVLGEGSRQANAPHILHIRDSQTIDKGHDHPLDKSDTDNCRQATIYCMLS